MSKIKQQFSDLRSNTPKHVQWLLLAAAFVIVLILLTLLIGGWNKASDDINAPENDKLQLFIDPSETLDLTNTPVGAKETQKFTITANAPVKIVKVRTNSDIAGLTMMDQCSTESIIIDKNKGCIITVTYAPDAPMAKTSASIFVDWRGARETDSLKKKETIKIALGAVGEKTTQKKEETQSEPKPEPKPEPTPVVIPQPEPEIDIEPEPEPEPEPVPVKEEIKQDIEAIAPSIPDIAPVKAANKTSTAPATKQDSYTPQPEACSDFAFPGYDASGRQIGWIKPEGGAYYFHPFSDKDCDSPTGVYNPDNGIISDMKDASKKIGSDAEHIGYAVVTNGTMPQLSSAPRKKSRTANNTDFSDSASMGMVQLKKPAEGPEKYISNGEGTVVNSMPYDRSFILRQYKPIPATIVSDVRADVKALEANTIPVRATVDRNVYADNGRTVIIPTGTLLMGYVTGTLPGPYTSIGRMEIKWYQFVLPNGVEFNFQSSNDDPFSADAQGRVGVPGRGSTDYLEQFVMPMLTAIVPAAVNMIAPIADKFVNQIDLDNNTVVQSGTVRSSELAKNEIITAWNQVAQKLLVDMMDNTTPPFSIPAGTRITVYSPVDLQLTCGDPESNPGKKCAVKEYSTTPRRNQKNVRGDGTNGTFYVDYNDGSWVGQVRSFNWTKYCKGYDQGKGKFDDTTTSEIYKDGLDYSSVLFYCQSNQYKAINNAKQDALYQNQKDQFQINYGTVNPNAGGITGIQGSKEYNEGVLGLKYDDTGTTIINPFQSLPKEEPPVETNVLTCIDGTAPDANGCCTGEIYTDMGDQGFNCCPETGGDCFPPIL